jgi:hypothetical protein
MDAFDTQKALCHCQRGNQLGIGQCGHSIAANAIRDVHRGFLWIATSKITSQI